MTSTCPELKKLLSRVQNRSIPPDLRAEIEAHLESCHACRADFNRFLKIGHILQRTVYSNPADDKYLSYLSHIYDQRLHWGEAVPEQAVHDSRRTLFLLLKVLAGFVVAAGVGASLAVVFTRTGLMHRPAGSVDLDTLTPSATYTLKGPQHAPLVPDDTSAPLLGIKTPGGFTLTDSISPGWVSEALNREEKSQAAEKPPAPSDSAHLHVLQAELGALRDALSRSPRDNSLVQRSTSKAREVIDERKRLGLAARVSDYYNLGYAHFVGREYRQAILATTEGLQKVKIGPTEYLHYLKAMSHFRLAQRLLEPLPADSSADPQARLQGAVLRSKLDVEGRRNAVNELRNSINEFSNLLNRTELEPIARSWILELNRQIDTVSKP